VAMIDLEYLLVAVRHVAHQIGEIQRGVIIHVRLHVSNPWPGASHPSVYDVDACSIGPPAVPQPLEHLIKGISVDMNTRQACYSVARADLQRASKEYIISMLIKFAIVRSDCLIFPTKSCEVDFGISLLGVNVEE
jgi:hypothetical protein